MEVIEFVLFQITVEVFVEHLPDRAGTADSGRAVDEEFPAAVDGSDEFRDPPRHLRCEGNQPRFGNVDHVVELQLQYIRPPYRHGADLVLRVAVARDAGEKLAAFAAAGVEIENLTVGQPSLEDVFIAVTTEAEAKAAGAVDGRRNVK